jgi:DNA-binding GntR family transcriptional regulator
VPLVVSGRQRWAVSRRLCWRKWRDRAEGPIHYHHSVVQKGFNRDEEEAQALIQRYTHL